MREASALAGPGPVDVVFEYSHGIILRSPDAGYLEDGEFVNVETWGPHRLRGAVVDRRPKDGHVRLGEFKADLGDWDFLLRMHVATGGEPWPEPCKRILLGQPTHYTPC